MDESSRHPALGAMHRAAHPGQHEVVRETIVRWACGRAHLSKLSPHYMLLGTPGSGKTTLMKILMNSVFPDPKYGLRFRGLVYDPKTEFYPFLVRMGIAEERIIVTNPFDARSAAWNLARDFTSDGGHAEALASALIPAATNAGESSSKDFFNKAANQVLTDAIEGLMSKRPEDWQLRDVLEVCLDNDLLTQVLKLTRTGSDTFERYLGGKDARLSESILATLSTATRPYLPVASLWHSTNRWFSVTDWHKGSGVILLGTDPEREEVLDSINQLLMRRVTQVIRRADEGPAQKADLTWFFFDELSGVTTGFSNFSGFLRESRSKGARVVLAFQDLAGLREVFGKEQAMSLLSVCGNKGFLNLGCPETAKWVSDLFAHSERKTRTEGTSSDGKTNESWSTSLVAERLPIEFLSLPLAENNGGAIRGIFHHPGDSADDAFEASLSADEVDRFMPPKRNDLPQARIDREDGKHRRVPWGNGDLARFGMAGPRKLRFLDDEDNDNE